jgi:hypothetical protein
MSSPDAGREPRSWLVRKLVLVKEVVPLVMLFLMVLLARVFPSMRRKLEQKMVSESDDRYTPAMKEMGVKVPMAEFARVFYSSFEGARQIVHSRVVNSHCAVQEGSRIADVPLLRQRDGARVMLSSLLSAGRPLVLNFGSCT